MSSFKIRNASNTGWLDAASSTGFKVRNVSNSGWIDKTSTLSGVAVRNSTNTGWITFAGGVGYSISPNITSVNEGSTITYTVNTTGFGSGILYWSNSGTTNASDFTDGVNSGSVVISGNTGSFTRTLINDLTTEGSETIILQLRTGSIAGPVVSTASTVNVADSSTSPSFPTSLTITRNNLEFYYSGYKTSSVDTAYVEFIFTLNTSNFWNLATGPADHIIMAFDQKGDSSVFGTNGTRDHCGQIVRNGFVLYDEARGYIIRRDGHIWSEHWLNGEGIGFNDYGFCFDPVANPIFTVRIRAGYRNGTYKERMEVDVFSGTSTAGPLLTGIGTAWGWDWSGLHRFGMGLIAAGFISPNDTGCIETSAPGTAAGATVAISNFNFNVYNV